MRNQNCGNISPNVNVIGPLCSHELYLYLSVLNHAGGVSCVVFKQEASVFIWRPPLLRATGQTQGQLGLSSDKNICLDMADSPQSAEFIQAGMSQCLHSNLLY